MCAYQPHHLFPTGFELFKGKNNPKHPVKEGDEDLHIVCGSCSWMLFVTNLSILSSAEFHAFYVCSDCNDCFTGKPTDILHWPEKDGMEYTLIFNFK